MFRFDTGYLLPRYNRTRIPNDLLQDYDGLDDRDPGSEETARKFLENFEAWKLEPDTSTEHAEKSSDSEESLSSSDDESQDETADTEKLRARFAALLTQFPTHSMHIKAAAYQAGIYQSAKSSAYDPQINHFFRVMGDVDESKLPAEVAAFCKELKDHNSSDCIRRKYALPFSKQNLEQSP